MSNQVKNGHIHRPYSTKRGPTWESGPLCILYRRISPPILAYYAGILHISRVFCIFPDGREYGLRRTIWGHTIYDIIMCETKKRVKSVGFAGFRTSPLARLVAAWYNEKQQRSHHIKRKSPPLFCPHLPPSICERVRLLCKQTALRLFSCDPQQAAGAFYGALLFYHAQARVVNMKISLRNE